MRLSVFLKCSLFYRKNSDIFIEYCKDIHLILPVINPNHFIYIILYNFEWIIASKWKRLLDFQTNIEILLNMWHVIGLIWNFVSKYVRIRLLPVLRVNLWSVHTIEIQQTIDSLFNFLHLPGSRRLLNN